VTLQLACVGSCSQINHRVNSTINLGTRHLPLQADIVNIDCYNVILGVAFMRAHNVVLDFARDTIIFDGKILPVLKEGEGSAMQDQTRKPFVKKANAEKANTVNLQLTDGHCAPELGASAHAEGVVPTFVGSARHNDLDVKKVSPLRCPQSPDSPATSPSAIASNRGCCNKRPFCAANHCSVKSQPLVCASGLRLIIPNLDATNTYYAPYGAFTSTNSAHPGYYYPGFPPYCGATNLPSTL
jgi:hypothetical protein